MTLFESTSLDVFDEFAQSVGKLLACELSDDERYTCLRREVAMYRRLAERAIREIRTKETQGAPQCQPK